MLTIQEHITSIGSIGSFYVRVSVSYVSAKSKQKQQRSLCFYKMNHLMTPI